MSKYLAIGGTVAVLLAFSYLIGKLYFTQNELIACKSQKVNLEAHLGIQNSQIEKHKALSDKSLLKASENTLFRKYEGINKKFQQNREKLNTCQSVLDSYLKIIKKD